MYTIIGGDQKQYGPISADDIKKWIAEGRLNAQSLVKGETDENFRPLGGFPEFVDALATAVPAAPAPLAAPIAANVSQDDAAQRLKGPAIALIITSALGIVVTAYVGVRALIVSPTSVEAPPDMSPQFRAWFDHIQQMSVQWRTADAILYLLGAAVAAFVLVGAVKMLQLRSHTLAIIACVAAMLPCQCCCFLSLPFAIWAIVILNKPEVKSQFS